MSPLIYKKEDIIISPDFYYKYVNPLEYYDFVSEVSDNYNSNLCYLVKQSKTYIERMMKEINTTDQKYYKDIKENYEILRNLNHPKIVKIFEVYRYKSFYYEISEYFSNGILENFLKYHDIE